jgi:broad specificity phosphatase PhoE
MRVLIVRHGQSAWNAQGRWQGWTDVPLTPLGEEQAAARAAALAAEPLQVARVHTSDLRRAARTAHHVAAAFAVPVVADARFRERNAGEWQGHTAAEIDERWPGERERWRRRELQAPPGGETDQEVLARFDDALADAVAATPEAHAAIVVTHGGVLRLVTTRAGSRGDAGFENVGGYWFTWDGAALAPGEPLASLHTGGVTAVE